MSGWLRHGSGRSVCRLGLPGLPCIDALTLSMACLLQLECHDINKLPVREREKGLRLVKMSAFALLQAFKLGVVRVCAGAGKWGGAGGAEASSPVLFTWA
jgi:hypothetical protein